MIVRVLECSEAPQFRALVELSLRESPRSFSDSLREATALELPAFSARLRTVGDPPESFVLGAFDQGLIAMLTFRRDTRDNARHKSSLHSMYVHPDYRKRGLGSQLMNEVLLRAGQMPGLEQIHAWVIASENSARQFYLKHGFESQGLVRKDLKMGDSYVDCEYMVRYLKM